MKSIKKLIRWNDIIRKYETWLNKEDILELIDERIKRYRTQSILSKGLIIDKKSYREDFILKRFAEEFEELKARIEGTNKISKDETMEEHIKRLHTKGCEKDLPNNLYCGCGSHRGIILCDECKEQDLSVTGEGE